MRIVPDLKAEHPAVDLVPFIHDVLEHAEIYPSVTLEEPICTDPDDDKFFACALASGGRIIISGDKHLLKVSGYRGIQVLKPREFVDSYLE